MISKNHIKFIHSLQSKKQREKHNLFVGEGVKIATEFLNSDIKIRSIIATKDLLRQISYHGEAEIIEISETELKKISGLATPNKALIVAEIPEHDIKKEDFSSRLSVVLDNIQDPGNLGTIIRIADWFGIKNIVCSENSADAFNPKVVQATMGSIARVKVHYTDLGELLKNSKLKTRVYGAVLEGKNIYKESLDRNGLIVLGNESRGISAKLLPYISDKIAIPSFSADKSHAESLNVAIAAAIICSEFKRG